MSWQDIPGWFGFRGTYDDFVDRAKDGDTIVEIGVAFGRSLAYLGQRIIESKKHVRLVAVDPWLDDRWEFPNDYPTDAPRPGWGGEHAEMARALGGPFSAFLHCMTTHAPEVLERTTLLRCRSSDACKIIGPCVGVMIDGSHDYEAVAQDIALWRPHVRKGGLLAGDDYHDGDFPGVVRAVKEAFGDVRQEGAQDRGYTVDGTTWRVER